MPAPGTRKLDRGLCGANSAPEGPGGTAGCPAGTPAGTELAAAGRPGGPCSSRRWPTDTGRYAGHRRGAAHGPWDGR